MAVNASTEENDHEEKILLLNPTPNSVSFRSQEIIIIPRDLKASTGSEKTSFEARLGPHAPHMRHSNGFFFPLN